MKDLADRTSGLLHPSPIEIRSAIREAICAEQERREAEKLEQIPWNIMGVISGAIAQVCEAHYRKQDTERVTQ